MTRLCTMLIAMCAGLSACGGPSGAVLSDPDAGRLAKIALDAWALGRSAIAYQVNGCVRPRPAAAACTATIVFADNPDNPRQCMLAITVIAVEPRIGTKDPTATSPGRGLEIEEYELSNGGYATYAYGDPAMCDRAQYESGF